MCLLLRCTAARASRSKRSTARGIDSAAGSIIFSATSLPRLMICAATTNPMPPVPSTRITSGARGQPRKVWTTRGAPPRVVA